MAIRSIEIAPLGYARLGGALYHVIILFGAFEESFIANKFIAGGAAAATAQIILASSRLWQVGIASNVSFPFCGLNTCCRSPQAKACCCWLCFLIRFSWRWRPQARYFVGATAHVRKCPVPAGLWSSTSVDAGESCAEASRDFLQYCLVRL